MFFYGIGLNIVIKSQGMLSEDNNFDYRFVFEQLASPSRIVLLTRHLQDLTQCPQRCQCP